jgi:hypothetical protein
LYFYTSNASKVSTRHRIGWLGHVARNLPPPHIPAPVSIRQRMRLSDVVQQTAVCWNAFRQMAYVSMCQHVSAYVSMCQHMSAYVSMCQHMSADVSMCQHMSAYVRMSQHMSACVRMCHDMWAFQQMVVTIRLCVDALLECLLLQLLQLLHSKLCCSCCIAYILLLPSHAAL